MALPDQWLHYQKDLRDPVAHVLMPDSFRLAGFDEFAEEIGREFYAEKRGRPSIPPGVYFRMLMVGHLDVIGSERGIAWRCADSISLTEFLGYELAKDPVND